MSNINRKSNICSIPSTRKVALGLGWLNPCPLGVPLPALGVAGGKPYCHTDVSTDTVAFRSSVRPMSRVTSTVHFLKCSFLSHHIKIA
jgi:hypothetical protein